MTPRATLYRQTAQNWLPFALLLNSLGLAGCHTLATNEKPDSVEVFCDMNLGLTAASGVRKDWSGTNRTWVAQVDGDQLLLKRNSACGQNCDRYEEIVLGIGGSCPVLVSARGQRYDPEHYGDITLTINALSGLLLIQDWNPVNGLVSGRLESEVEFVFYAEFDAQPRNPVDPLPRN